ncbi:MAG: alpha/beta fold hydrolase [Alphaproteobacteria bacterium]|nr:alpha/beta fold hydrolase [Alphaproteobacteria bacterium SS10]
MFDNLERRRSRIGFEPIQEAFPWVGGDLQTMKNAAGEKLGRLPQPGAAERVEFPTDDGSGDILIGKLHRPSTPTATKPLMVLVHGLTGCEGSPDILLATDYFLARGYPVLRLNQRGAGPSGTLCKGFYHAGRSADLRLVIEAMAEQHGLADDGVVLMGSSLGGNASLKLAGEYGDKRPDWLKAVISVSAPIDLFATSYQFLKLRNRAYHQWLLRRMKAQCADPDRPLADWARQAARSARDTYDFDDKFTGPINGWSGADQYYAVNSANRYIDDARLPVLLIHAENDPWVPVEPYHVFDWSRNRNLMPLIASGGGHCGFHGTDGPWHLAMTERFINEQLG